MVVDKDANRFIEKRDLVHIIILFAIALGIGVYLIATTVLISGDGMSYINYAKGLGIDPFKVIRDSSEYAPRLYTPGYPFLILMAHKIVDLFGDGSSILSWIYSAQAAALLCRILALIPLYFIGKELVNGKLSFWAMLVLVILPYPARLGSDVLRAWPHILFLATGFLFLLWAAKNGKWLMFALVGISAGFGYTVRPMCAQLVMYGIMWLTYSLFKRKHKCGISRAKLAGGLALLIIGFAVVVVPYMRIRGEILPNRLKKITAQFSLNSVEYNTQQLESFSLAKSKYTAGLSISKSNITKAFTALICRIGEHLMYYFVPALFIGMYYHFRRTPKNEVMFFIATFFLTNVGMVILRYCVHPDLSRRYVLPLVVFTIFFVPLGLQIISRWVEGMISRRAGRDKASPKELQRRFLVLLIIGLAICIPKLFKPIRLEKKGYLLASEWLKENTGKQDIVAVSDKRISFYAERKGLIYGRGGYVPGSATSIISKVTGQIEPTVNTPAVAVHIVIVAKQKEKQRKSEPIGYSDNENDAFLSDLAVYTPLKRLRAYWPADDTRDCSIYGNNMTLYGKTGYVTSKYGQAFKLTNSTGDYIACKNNVSLNPTNFITLSAWIYPIAASKGSIITKNGPYSIEFWDDCSLRVGIHTDPPSWTYVKSISTLSLNTWHHVAMTYDGSYIRIYIDGESDSVPKAKSGKMTLTHAASVFIGYGIPGFDNYFDGLIDEVMIFQEALLPDKIKLLYEMVESQMIPTFAKSTSYSSILDCWRIEKVYPLWADKNKRQQTIAIYRME